MEGPLLKKANDSINTDSGFEMFLRVDRGLSPLSITAYLSDVSQAQTILSQMGSTLETAGASDIQSLKENLLKNGLGHRSLARKLSAIRLYYIFQERTDAPWESLKGSQISKPLPQTISEEEVFQLLQSIKSKRDMLMFRLLYATGLRVSELTSLKVTDLELALGHLRIRGKGQKIRLIPFDATTGALLSSHLEDRESFLKTHSRSPAMPPEVFLSRLGRPFTRQSVWRLLQEYSLAAGIHPLPSPHTLRHAFATHLLDEGMNLRCLQMLLGHADISTTEVYSHVSSQRLKDVLETKHPLSHRATLSKKIT